MIGAVAASALFATVWCAAVPTEELAIVASIPLGLGWLLLIPLAALSSYAAYEQLFGRED